MVRLVERNPFRTKQTPCSGASRPRRVLSLITSIILLSLADLYITLMYLHSGGMSEANPVARWIMGHGSPALLAAWKVGTVTLAGVIFFRTRHTRSGEVGAWICMLLLTWLTVRWGIYAEEAHKITPNLHVIADDSTARWVTMTPTP